MKPRTLLPVSRRARLALAGCGTVLLVTTGWLLRDWSATAPAVRVSPLEPVLRPQAPGDLFKGHESAVRPSLVEALALAKDVPYPRRIVLLRAAGGGLSALEIDLLAASLSAGGRGSDAGGYHSTWFNEIANLLHREPAARQRLARALATVAGDPSRDATARDYALQHLRLVWNDADGDTGLRDSITESLRRLAGADNGATTAARLSLHLLGDNAPAPGRPVARALPDDEFATLAGGLLEGPAGSRQPAERMTAARIAGDRRLADLRPALARVASDPAEHTLSRISAINAIGRIGNPADRPLLESLAASNPSLAAATRDALRFLR
jgi:hypothetical protein